MDVPDNLDRIFDDAAARPVGEAAWVGRLQRGARGDFLASAANVSTILAHDPALAGLLGYDEFRARHVVHRPPPPAQPTDAPAAGPYPRSWSDADEILIVMHLQREYMPRVAIQAVQMAMLTAAEAARYHPVRAWLATLVWDGKPRIDRWLQATFEAPNTPLVRAIGAKTLIAAARRIRLPGCKFDNMPVLEGAQNIGKSTAVRALVPDELWFSDTIPPDIGGKEAMQSLEGVWIIEFAEIEHLLRAETETIKAFLSRQSDRYRPPYGRRYIDQPRQCIFIGTTNSTEYLRDETGNRRIWPVRCQSADPAWVVLNRDQLWAEAVVRDRAGEPIWLDDPEMIASAMSEQAARLTSDSWEESIRDYLLGMRTVRMSQILETALGFSTDKIQRTHEMRVGKILHGLGWESTVQRAGRVTSRFWIKKDI